MTTTTDYKCPGCDEQIEPEVDWIAISPVDGETYCESCHTSDMNYAAVVFVFGPGFEADSDGPIRYYVGSLFREDRWGEEPDLDFQQRYHRTDGWRGYTVTTIDGWVEIVDGWSTGDWGDPISDRKRPFREWCEGLHDGTIEPPCPVAVISDHTSNVFSTAMGVHVREDDREKFIEWLNGDLEVLHDALT